MPLVPGSSQSAIKENISIERKLGNKPAKQAVAIAFNEASKYGYKPKKKQAKTKKKGMK